MKLPKLPKFSKNVKISKALKGLQNIKHWPVWGKYSRLEWSAIVIGFLTIFYIFINFFTSYADNTPSPFLTSEVNLSDPIKFEETLATTLNSTVEKGSPIKILTNGQEFLPDLLSEISAAKESIYITDYIWDNGEFGDTVLKALAKRSKEGIDVRILLDGVSGRKASAEYIKEITDSGGKVGRFRKVTWWNINRIDRRTHVRDFVIDGTTAYIGGIAISDNWLGNATSSTSWHDFMFKIQGTMAQRANKIFSNVWSQTTGEILPARGVATEVANDKTASGTRFVSLFSTPSPDLSTNMQHLIWLSIMSSQKYIHIINPYLLPNKAILEALKNQARAGVDVELIVPGQNTDTYHTRWASQTFYAELLDAGVKIYEYQPSRIHAKVMVMDDMWSVIGSANLDNRSSEINLELNMGVNDPQFAKDLDAKFQEDRSKSKVITKEAWGKGPLFTFPLRLLSELFIHQY